MKNYVKLYRILRNMCQRELAELAGCSQQTISAIERGDVIPTVYVALRLSRALNAKVEELFVLD